MRLPPNKIFNILVFISASASAAPKGPPPPGIPPPPGLPIDGGVVACLLLAVLYGLFKLYTIQTKKDS